jgi:hypothetical protein
MTRHKRIAIYITGVFGFIYVMANAAYLSSTLAFAVRTVAVLAVVGLIVASPRPDRPDPPGTGFSRSYWIIVTGEIVIGLAGLLVINGVFGAHDASIAWISLVVGLHFFGFYVIWGFRIMVWVGAAITLCGVAGLVAAGIDLSAAAIAVTAGVVPGVVLLAAGWWSALHRTPNRAIGSG